MKQLKILDPHDLVGENGKTINMAIVKHRMATLGVDLILVPVLEGDTPDGRRQCKHCTEIKPVEAFAFRKRKGVVNTRFTPICRSCRDMHRLSWNVGTGLPRSRAQHTTGGQQ